MHYVNDNKLNTKKLKHNGTDMCNLLWFIVYLRANPKYKLQGLIFGGAYYRRVFCVSNEGLIFEGAYFRNFTVVEWMDGWIDR